MTPQALLAAYPSVQHAVAWTELVLADADIPGGETLLDMIRATSPPMTPDEVVAMIRNGTAAEVGVPAARTVLAEMDSPEYRTYIRGRLGGY